MHSILFSASYSFNLSSWDTDNARRNPKVYLGAAYHLSLEPSKRALALVAAHIEDLRAAEGCGFRSIYVRREIEDEGRRDDVRTRTGVIPAGVGSSHSKSGC